MKRFYDEDDYEAAIEDLFGEPAGDSSALARTSPKIHSRLFERIVSERKQGPSRACQVTGATSWSDMRCRGKLEFKAIRFDSEFAAEVAEFTTLRFVDCKFRGGAALRNCRIRGDLDFINCSFTGPPAKAGRLSLEGTRIDGHIEIQGTSLAGDLIANGAACLALKLDDVEIGGDCDLISLDAKRHVLLIKTRISGRLAPRFIRCSGLMRLAGGCSVGGELDFAGAQICSQLDLEDGKLGEIRFNGSTIGSLWIGSSGKIQCRGIYAIDSRFASYVRMSRLKVRVPPALARGPARKPAAGKPVAAARPRKVAPLSDEWGRIYFRHCSFGSQVWTWVWHRDRPDGGWETDNFVEVDKGVSIIDCDIGGELNLTRLKVGGRGNRAAGTVRLDRTSLRGWLFISSPTAVARRLDVPSEVRDAARACVETGHAMAPAFQAYMRSISLRDFSASGVELSGLRLVKCDLSDTDLDIDGSLVGERMRVAGTFTTYASLDGPTPEAQASFRAHADIAGALRLRGAAIGELRLAGESFRRRENCRAWNSGVVLELADIGLLRVPRVAQDKANRLNGFPVPLDLSGMTVRNWNFDEKLDADSQAGYHDYLDFLDNDETLHREVYKSVALSLRNAGRDRDAEKILFAEEYRARWETRHARARRERPDWPEFSRMGRPKGRRGGRAKRFRRMFGWLNRLIDWLDRVLLQYRRNPIALLYAILALFCVSTFFVSSHAANFEISEASRLVLQNENARADGLAKGASHETDGRNLAAGIDSVTDGQNVGPDPAKWSAWNAIWMATRYHVPIVSNATEGEYVASNDNRLRFGFPWDAPRTHGPGEYRGEIPFSAEDWFGLMALVNWIMWPLLLTFALRRALRSD